MRTNATHLPNSRISTAAARSQLAMLLGGATDQRLADMTVEALGRSYRLRPAEIDEMLTAARARRRLTVRDD